MSSQHRSFPNHHRTLTGKKQTLFGGLAPFQASRLPKEAIAGLTLAIVSIPEVMGYTKISGTPIITGIYTILFPMLIYSIFASSKHLVVAADSATAAILAGAIAPLVSGAKDATSLYMSYVVLLSFMVGIFLLLARILRLGFIAKFLSRTVLIGFLTGVGIQVVLGQVGGMLGLKASGTGTLAQFLSVLSQLPQTNPWELVISALVLGIILIPVMVRRFVSPQAMRDRIPWALIALVLTIFIGFLWRDRSDAFAMVGTVPGGLPKFTFPPIDLSEIITSILQPFQVLISSGALANRVSSSHLLSTHAILTLLPTALMIVVIIITQSAATIESYAQIYGEDTDENTDLLGLGLANLAAGFSGTFVVNGSPTKTKIADDAGGRSQWANIAAVIVVFLVLLFLTGPLQYLPEAALSALVFTIGLKLIQVKNLKKIYQLQKREFWIAILVMAVVVLWGAAQGIIMAMILALLWHIRRSYRPQNSLLRPVKNDAGYMLWDWQAIHPGIKVNYHHAIYHFAASIYYANVGVIHEEIKDLISHNPSINHIMMDCSAISDVDFTGGQALLELIRALHEKSIEFGLIQLSPNVREQLKRYGVMDMVGEKDDFEGMKDVMRHFEGVRKVGEEKDD